MNPRELERARAVAGRRRTRAVLLGLLLGWARPARAGVEPAPLAVNVESCPPAWDREIRRAIEVELGDHGAPGHTLMIRCDAHRALLVARDAPTTTSLDRTLIIDDLSEATAPRVVALAGVELLATLDPALRRRLAESNRAAHSGPSPRATPEDRHLFLTASGVYRVFFSTAGVQAWGGAVDARRISAGGAWAVGFGVEVAATERSATIGQTTALLGSAYATAGVTARPAGDWLALAVDVGARGGAARLSGHATAPDVAGSTVVRPWAGPVVTLRAQLGFSWFCTQLAAEGGWALVSASGLVENGPALAASGPWLALSLGVGLRP